MRPVPRFTTPHAFPPEGVDFELPICLNMEEFREFMGVLVAYRDSLPKSVRGDIGFMRAVHAAMHRIRPDCEDCPPVDQPSAGCLEYELDRDEIVFFPNNPFDPDSTPQHWTAITEDNLEVWLGTGVQPGDVVSGFDPIAISDMLLNNRWPSVTWRGYGAGVLEIHLIQLVLGGLAKIEVVGESGARIVDTSIDITEIETWLDGLSDYLGGDLGASLFYAPLIVEIPLSGTRWHEVKITLYPKIGIDNLLPVGFGGGIRKFVWCGEDIAAPPCVPQRPELKIEDGCVKWLNPINGQWECALDLPAPPPCPECPPPLAAGGDDCDDCGGCDECENDCEEC